MITAQYVIGDKPRGSSGIEYRKREEEFTTIDDLENFLAYNRAYIVELSFSGSIKYEVPEEEYMAGPSLQVCDREQCLEDKANNFNSIAKIPGTPRPTRPGYCSWCWSELKINV